MLLSCYSKIECIMKGKQKGYWTSSTLKWRPGSLTDPLLNLWGSFVVPYGLTRLSAVTQFVKVTINALTPFAVTNRPGSKLRRFSLHKQLPHQINFFHICTFSCFQNISICFPHSQVSWQKVVDKKWERQKFKYFWRERKFPPTSDYSEEKTSPLQLSAWILNCWGDFYEGVQKFLSSNPPLA